MLNINNDEWLIRNGRLIEYRKNEDEVVIPEGVTEIESTVFRGKKFGTITMPGTIRKFPPCFLETGFYKDKIILKEGIEYITPLAFCRANVKEVVFPNSLKVIGKYAFSEAFYSYHTRLILNHGLEKIEECAFKNALHFDSIVIPKTVVEIASDAFAGCQNYSSLYCFFSNATKLNLFEIQDFKEMYHVHICTLNDFNMRQAISLIKPCHEKCTIYFEGYSNPVVKAILDTTCSGTVTMTKEITSPEFLNKESVILPETSNLMDKEIDDLINQIKSKILLLDADTRNSISNQLNYLIDEYRKNLEEAKPKFGLNVEESLTTLPDIPSIRIHFITNLNKIIMYMNRLDNTIALRKKINHYKEFIVKGVKPQESDENFQKIEDIILKTNSFTSNEYVKNSLFSILNEIDYELEKSFKTFFHTSLTLSNFSDYETILATKIEEFYAKVLMSTDFYQALFGNHKTSLGNDIETLKTIIASLDTNSQSKYENRLTSVLLKYNSKIEHLEINYHTEIEIRKELMPIIRELANIVGNITDRKSLLDDLTSAKNLLAGDEINYLGSISSTIKDIMNLLSNQFVDEILKQEIITSLNELLNNSYSQIINNTFPIKENSIMKNFNLNFQITLQILKSIYGIKFNLESFIKKTSDYNASLSSMLNNGKHNR